jgi:hypothetical protein
VRAFGGEREHAGRMFEAARFERDAARARRIRRGDGREA